MRDVLRRLTHDTRAATIIEFAIVAPTMLVLIMGLGDLLYQGYAQSILDGAVQKAARDGAIQGGAEATDMIDGKVVALISSIVKDPAPSCGPSTGSASWCTTRKNYDNFSSIRPEGFTDTNDNRVRDPGECFDDINDNKTWDADPGSTGQGGANDVTVYTFTLTYPRLFPVWSLIGWPTTQTIASKTILKNQPYASQSTSTVTSICT